MSTRALFVVIGVAWGLLAGVIVGLVVYAATTGRTWLSILADAPGPEAADRGELGMALAIALAMLVGGAIGGWRYGRHVGDGTRGRLARTRRAGYRLLGLWAVAAVALLVAVFLGAGWQSTERQAVDLAAQEAAFTRLLAERHAIERIDFFGWNAASGTAGVAVRGARRGTYRFAWQIAEPTHNRVLDSGGETVPLEPGRRTIIIRLDLGRLAAAYGEQMPTVAGGGLIEETLHLTASLEPVPSPAEGAALPPSALQDLVAGRSPLRDVGLGTVPASLQIPSAPAHSTD